MARFLSALILSTSICAAMSSEPLAELPVLCSEFIVSERLVGVLVVTPMISIQQIVVRMPLLHFMKSPTVNQIYIMMGATSGYFEA